MKEKLKHAYLRIKGLFPHALPQGMKELEDFIAVIFETYNIPNMASYRQAVATMIMHLGPTTHQKAPYFFAKSIKKAAANQIAYEMIQLIRDNENAKQQDKQIESPSSQPSNEQPISDTEVQTTPEPVVQ